MISGSEHPIPPIKQLLSKLITYGQYAVVIMMIAGDWIFRQIGMAPPAIYYRMKEKQFIVIMACMFIGGQISNSLMSTGAFELYLDGNLIFSKLATGRMPSPQEIELFL